MSSIKYIFELTEEEVKILAYGGMPRELKGKLMEISYYIDTRKKIELVKNKRAVSQKLKAEIKKPITLDEIKKTKPKAYDLWTGEEEKELKKAFLGDCNIKDISKQFQRSIGAIRHRLFKLGLIDEDNV